MITDHPPAYHDYTLSTTKSGGWQVTRPGYCGFAPTWDGAQALIISDLHQRVTAATIPTLQVASTS